MTNDTVMPTIPGFDKEIVLIRTIPTYLTERHA